MTNDTTEQSPAFDSPLPQPTEATPEPDSQSGDGLDLHLNADSMAVEPGDMVTFTLTLTNSNSIDLNNLSIKVSLGESLEYVPDNASLDLPGAQERSLNFAVDTLAAADQLTLTWQAQLARDAFEHVTCSVFVESQEPAHKASTTTIVYVGGAAHILTNDGLDAGWQMLYNPPVVSTFSGAVTFNYPIDVPPGRNGLQPNVNFSYNSRAVDGTTWWVDSGWVGIGWSVGTIDITRGRVAINQNSHYYFSGKFNLSLNSASHTLLPDSGVTTFGYGRYYAENAPGLHIEFFGSNRDPATEYWVVRTQDGTQWRQLFLHCHQVKRLLPQSGCHRTLAVLLVQSLQPRLPQITQRDSHRQMDARGRHL